MKMSLHVNERLLKSSFRALRTYLFF